MSVDELPALGRCKQLYRILFDGLYREIRTGSVGGKKTGLPFRQLTEEEVEGIDMELDRARSHLNPHELMLLRRWCDNRCRGQSTQRWLKGISD